MRIARIQSSSGRRSRLGRVFERLGVATTGLAVLIALTASPRLASAQVALRSEVDARSIGIQDQVQLTITAEGPNLPDQVALPALVNLRVVGGPGVSTQISWVNGRSSQSRSWTYVLQPTAVGHAEVGAARARFGSEEASAPAIAIEVAAGSVKPRQPARRAVDPFGDDPFGALSRARTTEPKVLVEAQASRASVFVGEPVLLTYYLYTQSSISGLQLAEAPQYPGFWTEDLESPARPTGDQVTVGGVAYRRFPVMLKLLFPTKSGRLVIPASRIRIGIAQQTFFDAGGVVERSTKPVTVQVKPLPEEPGFSGAVGHFKTTATVDRSNLALGDAATLRFRVEGNGNLKWVDRAPELVVPGAKIYPPQIKSDLSTRTNGIVGSRTWEFVVVPQTTGTLEIPSLEFSYFDPSAGRITHSTTPALPLRVEGGAPGSAPPPAIAAAGAARGGPLALRADLDASSPAARALPGSWVGAIAALTLLLHGLLWGGGRIAGRTRRAVGRPATSRGARGALGDLERVGRDGMSKEAAAGLIEKTIHGVFGSLDGDDTECARAVRALLVDVHQVRYAPQLGDYSEKLRELAARAGEVVRRWA